MSIKVRFRTPDANGYYNISGGYYLLDVSHKREYFFQSFKQLKNTGYYDIIMELDCSNCELTKLPKLPVKLKKLNCSSNKLTKLPKLPITLNHLNYSDNSIKKIKNIPKYLFEIIYHRNGTKNISKIIKKQSIYC